MGKQSNTIKPRTCRACGTTIETTSNGLRKHFDKCCWEKRQSPEPKKSKIIITDTTP